MRDTLAAFENLRVPGSMAHLPHRWSASDRWKDKVFAPSRAHTATDGGCGAVQSAGAAQSGDEALAGAAAACPTESSTASVYEDDRVERHRTPQYQSHSDAEAARASHDGEDCLVCAGIDF